MKTIIFITNSFPFGFNEKSFIEPEFNILKEKFNFIVVARNTTDEQTVEIPTTTKIYRYDAKKEYSSIKLLFRALLQKDLYVEWFQCLKAGKADRSNTIGILRFMMRSLHFQKYLKNVRKQCEEHTILFYTYWNDYATYTCARIKRSSDKIISRIHGGDLYLERNNQWQPYKNIINDQIDYLYFISEGGRQYYRNTFKDYPEKLKLSYMGVKKSSGIAKLDDKDYIDIISVSRCVDVKRLELIIDFLACIEDIKLNWVHIGDGEKFESLKYEAEKKLSNHKNVHYEFKGYMKNEDIVSYLSRSSFDFFVNVSSSEGLPVTMMEAMSCGIPVIATDVGGVNEIVLNKKNGYLLNKDFSVDEILRIFNNYLEMSYEDKEKLKTEAYKTWETKFFDEINHKKFSKELELL